MDYFETISPTNIEELKVALSMATKDTKILAGGTDLVISIHENRIKPDVVIDISKMKDFKNILVDDGYVYIGAGVTFTEIEKSSILNNNATCLVDAAKKVGSPQIRNIATLVGNIANASACADGTTALVSLKARAVVMNQYGDLREVGVGDIILKPGKIAIENNEIILKVKFKERDKNQESAFVKVGSRKSVTISKINISAVFDINFGEKIINDVSIALGSVGEKSFISEIANERLQGKKIDSNLNYTIQKVLQDTIRESIKGRNSLPYKNEAIKGLSEDIFLKIFRDIV